MSEAVKKAEVPNLVMMKIELKTEIQKRGVGAGSIAFLSDEATAVDRVREAILRHSQYVDALKPTTRPHRASQRVECILDLEFKVIAESNSGVFLRSGDIKNVLSALEIQVHDSADGSKYGMVAAIYDAMPPSKSAAKPVGEWNRFTITCKGPLVTVLFNGEEVINANLDHWPEVKKNPDGTPNKFPVALKDFARQGPIGLQGLHGKAQAPVWYRNVKIKVIE